MLLAFMGMLPQLPLDSHPSAMSRSWSPPASEALEQNWWPYNDRAELQGTMLPVTLGTLTLWKHCVVSPALTAKAFLPRKDVMLPKRELGVT